jgi:23S rRNA (adenine-N6)-dimethyltransferase
MVRRFEYQQHFLRSPAIAAMLIGHTNIRKNDIVYDFGAGSGVIAEALAQRCKRVVAIEHEAGILAKLRTNLAKYSNVEIQNQLIEAAILPEHPYKVFSNPPFSLSALLFERLNMAANLPKAIYCIVQRQFALKVVPSDRHFTSALGIKLAINYQAKIRIPLHRSDFTPPPHVDTVLLALTQREVPLIERLQQQLFFQYVDILYRDNSMFIEAIHDSGIAMKRQKPSECSPQQWVQLFEASTRN